MIQDLILNDSETQLVIFNATAVALAAATVNAFFVE